MRPESMSIIGDMRDQNILALEHAKKNNHKIVGMYCAYSPQELIIAAGAAPVSLCGTKQEPIAQAEKHLPRNLCPLIKSSFGFAVSDTCPYFRHSDFLIAETTCDGKKKMYELLSQYKPMHVMHLPQGTNRSGALRWWLEEIYILKEQLEKNLNATITEDKLRQAIKLVNRERVAMRKLHEVSKLKPSPISGIDMLTAIWMKGFNVDKEQGIKLINELTSEIMELVEKGQSPFTPNTPRLLITGCPVGIGSEKVVRIAEESSANVVAFENCTGYKTLYSLVDEDENRNPYEAIAERYLNIPCSCMSPNAGRYELIKEMAAEYQVDGVIDLTWQACHTYNAEGKLLRHYVENELDLPYLHIETDYSQADLETLRVRIEAFLEML
ncbi:double-cubane-cluster-containing anaerobic reductase [Peptococcaceae bacterium 1198_IL3148]